MPMASKRVILWTAPRSVSTAFERSMRTLKHCKVFHEPYGDAYYFGPEKKTDLFSDTVMNISSHSGSTYASTTAMLLGDFPKVETVFVKDMSFYVESNYEHIMTSGLSTYTHTFLIRRPDKAIYSNYKCGQKIPNWKFYPNEAGFSSLYKLFKYVQQMYNGSLVVVDADDLLSAPDEMMEAYCKAVGIRHDPRMTHWEPGLAEDWQHAADGWTDLWYKSVSESSGFIRRVGDTERCSEPVIPSDVPDEVSACITECWPLYEEMYSSRLQL